MSSDPQPAATTTAESRHVVTPESAAHDQLVESMMAPAVLELVFNHIYGGAPSLSPWDFTVSPFTPIYSKQGEMMGLVDLLVSGKREVTCKTCRYLDGHVYRRVTDSGGILAARGEEERQRLATLTRSLFPHETRVLCDHHERASKDAFRAIVGHELYGSPQRSDHDTSIIVPTDLIAEIERCAHCHLELTRSCPKHGSAIVDLKHEHGRLSNWHEGIVIINCYAQPFSAGRAAEMVKLIAASGKLTYEMVTTGAWVVTTNVSVTSAQLLKAAGIVLVSRNEQDEMEIALDRDSVNDLRSAMQEGDRTRPIERKPSYY